MSASAAEYGRIMGEGDAATIQALKAHRQAMCSTIERHQGHVVVSEGGRLLAVFDIAAEEAIAEAERGVELDPNSGQAYYNLAVVLRWAGKAMKGIPDKNPSDRDRIVQGLRKAGLQ